MGDETLDRCWTEEPLVIVLASEEILKEFCIEVSKIQAKLVTEMFYNSVTSHIRFYQEYKSGDTPMPEFYHNHEAIHYADSPNCVGNALAMKKGLLDPESYFLQHYLDLEQYLYFATSNIWAYNWLEEIPSHREIRPALKSAPYKQHILVALKFSLENRDGYLLMDIGYNISFPVIVMADGKLPHTEPFRQIWKKGPVEMSFKLEGNYIHWIERGIDENPSPPANRWIYVAKKFTKLLEVEKRNRVYDFHAIAKRRLCGPEAAISFVFGKDNGVNILIKPTSDDEEDLSLSIPFGYLMSDRHDNAEYEDAIEKCAVRIEMDVKTLKKTMKDIAEIDDDKSFLESMLKLNAEHIDIIENSWRNE